MEEILRKGCLDSECSSLGAFLLIPSFESRFRSSIGSVVVSLKVVSSTQLNITRLSTSSAFHELSQLVDRAYNNLYYPLQCRCLCAMALETIEGQRAALQDVMRPRPDYDSAIVQALKVDENSPPLCLRFRFFWSDLLISLNTPQLMSFSNSECTYPPTPRSLFPSVSSKWCSCYNSTVSIFLSLLPSSTGPQESTGVS
jgi:hypothetical protein